MATLPLSEVSSRLNEMAELVSLNEDRCYITRDGRNDLVLLSARELDSIEATLELLRDPEAIARIANAESTVALGDVTSAGDFRSIMEQRRAHEPPS